MSKALKWRIRLDVTVEHADSLAQALQFVAAWVEYYDAVKHEPGNIDGIGTIRGSLSWEPRA